MSHYEVIVIGAGQAGLSIGRHLSRQGRDFTILDAADGPAAAWRARWALLGWVKADAEHIARAVAETAPAPMRAVA